MKTNPIIFTTIFCIACAGSLLYFAVSTGKPIGKIQERADLALATATQPDPSGKPNTTTIFKSNFPMPAEISEALAKAWIDKARAARHNAEIADIVKNQTIEPCEAPGRVRMADGRCWIPETWKKLHPND